MCAPLRPVCFKEAAARCDYSSLVARVYTHWLWWYETRLIRLLASNSLIAARASEAFTFSLSTSAEGVMSFIWQQGSVGARVSGVLTAAAQQLPGDNASEAARDCRARLRSFAAGGPARTQEGGS